MARQNDDWLLRLWAALAGLTVILVIVNAFLFTSDQKSQAEVNRRQQFINQSIQLERLYESIVRAIATASVNNNDQKLRDLLTKHGVNFTVQPTGSGAAKSAPTVETPSPAPSSAPPAETK